MQQKQGKRKPSLRTLVIGATAGAFTVMSVVLYVTFSLSMEKFLVARESDNISNQAALADSALRSSVGSLPSVTRDWSSWDATYEYATGEYDEFLDDYLTDYPFRLFRFNLIAILDTESRVVSEQFYDYRRGEFMDVPDLSALYQKLNPATMATFVNGEELTLVDSSEIGLSGFVEHGGQIYYLSAYPILRSDETGPCAGSLVFGRVIDAEEIAFLTEDAGTFFEVGRLEEMGLASAEVETLEKEGRLVVAGKENVAMYRVFSDIFGNETMALVCHGERTLFQEGSRFIDSIVIIMAVFCAVILGFILLLLNHIVARPLGKLAREVNDIEADVSSGTLEPGGNSREMASLSSAINSLLARIQEDRAIIKQNNDRLFFHANHDMLTNLRNRFSSSEDLEGAIAEASLRSGKLSVFFIDLDRFKYINDTMGHSTGDDLIIEVADRLRESFEEEALISRTGGDEFLLTVKGIGTAEERLVFAERIFRIFRKPFRLRHREFTVSASIGSAAYPADGQDASSLIKNAEVAMYRAKEKSEGQYVNYQKDFHVAMERKIFLENEMRDCIGDAYRSFSAHFQPKLDLTTGRIASCEALMRWRLPGESVSPVEFIPLAEESGMIIPLSWWMLSECCRMGKLFADHGMPCNIAINMSAQVLLHDDFLPVLRSAVSRTGIDLSCIDFEILESTLVADVEKINLVLNELHGLGAEISVDDFGTGYSSLGYLNRMAVDRIKIDRSFISKLGEDPGEQELVNTIINMGKNLRMVVTAEGVEEEAQYRFLQQAGCDEIQGYLVSPALPGDVFIDFAAEWNRRIEASGEGPVF